MKRDITEKLTGWKDSTNRKPLLLLGVRQCGKTFVLQEFGKNAFNDCAYFNFERNSSLKDLFEYDLNPARIIDELSAAVLGRKIVPGKTVVIFDEVQACPRAVTSLKYFCEEMPQLHLIAAGSLLGVALKRENISFPVGKVDRMQMYPMTFTEFAAADGGEAILESMKKFPLDRPLPESYRVLMEKYFKNYLITGGMPEVVQTWVNTHDYTETEKIQERILKDYPDDFGKYASPETAVRIKLVWDSVPVQIAKENNKFIFSHVKSGARSKDLEDALQWLVESGLIYKLNLVSTPQLPLSAMADETYFKVYFSDVGLLRKKSNLNYRDILNGSDRFIEFKGALAENYVMTQLVSMGIMPYFWRSKNNAEMDFITDTDGVLVPVEVKAADHTKAKSLHVFCSRYKPKIAFKCSLRNIGDTIDGTTRIQSLPLYCIFRMKEYIFREMGW